MLKPELIQQVLTSQDGYTSGVSTLATEEDEDSSSESSEGERP